MVDIEPANIPDELQARDQWLLWDGSNDTPRQPHWAGDFTISWSDPDDWHSFEEAVEHASRIDSWGIGFVMAADNSDHARGLYGCLDLDGVLGEGGYPKDWLPSLERFVKDDAYIEVSPSGDGLHIPLVGQPAPDWWTDSHRSADEHEGVEYLRNKFCTFTGDVFHPDELEPDGVAETNPAPFLYEAYENLNGESPRLDAETDDSHSDREWTKDDVQELLDHVDSACEYPQWRNILFAVHDWDDGHSGKALAESWSRGSGWDEQSQRLIDAIWDGAEPGNGVTLGTLVHHAKQGGWEPSHSDDSPDPEDILSGDTDPPADDAEDAEDDGSDGEGIASWHDIKLAYAAADNADERLAPRYDASRRLMEESHWRTIEEADSLWAYDGDAGIYRPNGEAKLRTRLDEQLQQQFRANEQRELGEKIRARTVIPEEEMGGPAHHVCCANGVLELYPDEITLYDHDSEFEFIGRLRTEYDPDAECPRFRQFLHESIPNETDKNKLQEFAGYTLLHWALPYHKALFLVGPTASGKSTFLDTIRTMLGEDAVSSLTPQEMSSERFSGAELYGSWANIRNDIPNEIIENTGKFKELVAGDPIKAEEKYQDPFRFEPTAKHMFSTNELPAASTDDRAFYRRILLVAFPKETPRDERDKHLDDKLQAEHPGILNWALDGLQRLMKQDAFTGDRRPWETEETWEKWSDSAKRFDQLCLQQEGGSSLPTREVWQAYLAFCEDEGIPAKSRQAQLTKALKSRGYGTGRARIDGSQQRVLSGVAFTSRGEQYRDEDGSDGGGSPYDGGVSEY
jgi:putative DNA primase/helicase